MRLNISKKKLVTILTLVSLCLSAFIAHNVQATHGSWSGAIPDSVEHAFISNCPPSGSPGQTIHGVYPNPSTIPASASRTGSTNLYATSLICSTAPYTFVGDIDITVTSIVPNGTSATMSISGGVPGTFGVGDLSGRPVFANPVAKSASLSNLQDGWNCWTIYFYAAATHGSTRVTSGVGSWGVCVYFEGVPVDSGSCTITSRSPSGNLNPGDSFSATFRVSNTGDIAWPTGGRPLVSNYANRYKLVSQSPTNNTTWGKNRVELPGTSTFFGPVIQPGSTWTFTESGFTAPTTPGTYSFAWRIWQEGDLTGVGSICSMSITVINIPNLSCDSATVSPLSPESNQNFSVTVRFRNAAGAASYSGAGQLRIESIPAGLTMTDSNPKAYSPASVGGGSTGSATFNNWSGSAGVYNLEYELTSTESYNNVKNCPFTINISDKPYFRVNDGDVSAGMGSVLGSVCPGWGASSSGVIKGWHNGQIPPNIKGASTNLAAFAQGVINQFSSARDLGPGWWGLTFANSPLAGFYGGNFAGGIPCPTDYFATLPPAGSRTSVAGSFGPPSTNTTYYSSSSITINGTGFFPVGLGFRPIIYVDGDVTITGSITLAGGAGTVSQLPNFYVIARGDIFIRTNVLRLDGVYVAQPLADGSKGRIYTCTTGSAPPTIAQLDSSVAGSGCKYRKLTVNGAFIAKDLKLYRSQGSMSTGDPAETFNYTPATWLATPKPLQGGGVGGCCEAITSLPPIL